MIFPGLECFLFFTGKVLKSKGEVVLLSFFFINFYGGIVFSLLLFYFSIFYFF